MVVVPAGRVVEAFRLGVGLQREERGPDCPAVCALSLVTYAKRWASWWSIIVSVSMYGSSALVGMVYSRKLAQLPREVARSSPLFANTGLVRSSAENTHLSLSLSSSYYWSLPSIHFFFPSSGTDKNTH